MVRSSARKGQGGSLWSLALLGVVALGCSSRPKDVARLKAEVAGLKGSGLVLTVNAADVAVTSAGTLDLAALPGGMGYSVTVKAQPVNPPQLCTVTNGTGTMGSGAAVQVTCVDTHGFTGQVRGLTGAGLTVSLGLAGTREPLQLDPASASSFSFSARAVEGSPYEVRIDAMPTAPAQLCSLEDGSGTVGAQDVELRVVCSTQGFKVSGAVTNLRGTGLALQLNGAESIQVAAGASRFEFAALADQTSYTVAVAAQPSSPAQTCAVTGAQGRLAGADVTSVVVTCLDRLTAEVTGLKGAGLVLTANGTDFPVASAGSVDLGALAGGAAYSVSVKTQPLDPAQVCTVANGTGTMGSGGAVQVTCVDTHGLAGQVQGLAGTGLTLTLSVSGNRETIRIAPASPAFTFAARGLEGDRYTVQIDAAPTAPAQLCSVENESGTVGAQDVQLRVVCSTQGFKVAGTVANLRGSGLSLQLNGGASLQVPAGATRVEFPAALPDLSSYTVTVLTQPSSPTQTCAVTGDRGKLAGADVTGLAVTCTTTTYAVAGGVSGPVASGLVLALYAGGPTVTVPRDALVFAFPGVESGTAYDVQVAAAPLAPSQVCAVTGGRGTVGAGSVTTVAVTCHAVWKQVSVGQSHTMAIAQDGTLWGWGYNVDGQLGDGTQTQRETPVQIGKERPWASVSAGGKHTVAVAQDGTLWVWGSNDYGRLGDGLDARAYSPKQVGAERGWVSASASLFHTLAIAADDTLWAWGFGARGGLGVPSLYNVQATPIQPEVQHGLGTRWVEVATADSGSIAVASSAAASEVWAWSERERAPARVTIENTTSVVSVATGYAFSLAREKNGALWTWVSGSAPTRVQLGGAGFSLPCASASAAGSTAIAVADDGTLWTFTATAAGQLTAPVQVTKPALAWSAAAAGDHRMAIARDGTLWGWGANGNGQLGLGDTSDRTEPAQVW